MPWPPLFPQSEALPPCLIAGPLSSLSHHVLIPYPQLSTFLAAATNLGPAHQTRPFTSCSSHPGHVDADPRTLSHHVHWANVPDYKYTSELWVKVKTFLPTEPIITSVTSANASSIVKIREIAS